MAMRQLIENQPPRRIGQPVGAMGSAQSVGPMTGAACPGAGSRAGDHPPLPALRAPAARATRGGRPPARVLIPVLPTPFRVSEAGLRAGGGRETGTARNGVGGVAHAR